MAALEVEAAGSVGSVPWPHSQLVETYISGAQCTVLEEGEEIQGFIIFMRVLDEASLLNIAVAPTLQHMGFGRMLLEAGLTEQYQAGATQCFLEVRVSNDKAKKLYQSFGFSVIGERKDYYPLPNGKREHALVMSRELPFSKQAVV